MQRRRLGELEVSAVGLGCGTMTPFYGEPDRAAGIAIRNFRHRARADTGLDSNLPCAARERHPVCQR